MIERLADHLLISPADVRPSREDFKVVGTFNPGAVRWKGTTYLLVRVVETSADQPPGRTAFPRWDFSAEPPELKIDYLSEDEIDTVDHREIFVKSSGLIRLPFISHLRLATSRDGVTIDWIDPEPTITAGGPLEEYGVEDARITPLEDEDRCAITCVGPSSHGIVTSLMTTSDFKTFQRHGPIFTTENKDVSVFPGRVGGRYMALHRPLSHTPLNVPQIWYAESPDLLHWGGHRAIPTGRGKWFSRVGGGAPPVRVNEGYLEIYHGVYKRDPQERIGTYAAIAALLDEAEPWKVLARSSEPIISATMPYEREGFTPNVVFPTGAVLDGDRLLVYCGAADEFTAVTVLRMSDVMDSLVPSRG